MNESSENEDQKSRYMKVAWYLWGVGIVGTATEFTLLLIRGQYLGGNCKDNFILFAIIVSKLYNT